MADPVSKLQRDNDRLRAAAIEKDNEKKRLNRQLAVTEKELAKKEKELNTIHAIETAPRTKQLFKAPAKKSDKWHATAIFASSDLQLGELVMPEELHNFNAFDIAIGKMRFQYTAESVVKMLRDGMPTYEWDGIVVVLNGDPISNNIHEELQETNEGTPLETVLLAYELHAAMLRLFAAQFPKVHVVATPSNHGRTHKKVPFKQQARNSYDWLIAKMLENEFRTNDNVTFQISDAVEARFPVYDKTYAAEHGHHIKGYGDGVAGIAPTMARATMKRRDRDLAMGTAVDHYIYSHFHQLVYGTNWTLNGSYIGYNEMANALALGVNKPQQALLIATPERGVSVKLAIDCEAPGERKLWKTAGRNSW